MESYKGSALENNVSRHVKFQLNHASFHEF